MDDGNKDSYHFNEGQLSPHFYQQDLPYIGNVICAFLTRAEPNM